jgi:hypothetical protein
MKIYNVTYGYNTYHIEALDKQDARNKFMIKARKSSPNVDLIEYSDITITGGYNAT